MKYEKRKKSKAVDAVQLNSLADAERILKDCQHIYGIRVTSGWVLNDDERNRIEFALASEYITALQGQYIAWDDKSVWTMPADKFEKKYECVSPMTSIIWNNNIPHAYSSTNGATIKPL